MAKTKKDIILELKKQNPNLTPEEAAEQVPCTLAYAKRILEAEMVKNNCEIVAIGREIGLPEEQLDQWHEWIVHSLRAESAKSKFLSYLEYQDWIKRH